MAGLRVAATHHLPLCGETWTCATCAALTSGTVTDAALPRSMAGGLELVLAVVPALRIPSGLPFELVHPDHGVDPTGREIPNEV